MYSALFFPVSSKRTLNIFDFDETITIKRSFLLPIDPVSIKANLKKNIKAQLIGPDGLFSICSYIDSADNIIKYLSVIFEETPEIQEQKCIKLFSTQYQQEVEAYTITVLNFKQLNYPVCVTHLPKLTGADEKTGVKNLTYKMARAALKEHGEKNHPITTLSQYYTQNSIIDPNNAIVQFYDDSEVNVANAAELAIKDSALRVKSYVVTPGINEFKAQEFGSISFTPANI